MAIDKTMSHHEPPPITAAFLVVFDQKVGYTIAWKRSLSDIDLDGVEYKSLPSGLHAIKEDLVYFIQGAHAGISVFVQGEADAKHRNANFVAVGALVPLTYGQLGKSWAHAEELRALAKDVVKHTDDTRALELFWRKHRADGAAGKSSVGSATKRDEHEAAADKKKRKRAMSEATLAGFDAEHALPADHPALNIPAVLDTFGPLLFPLHRAILSRKRVLLLGNPPVQANANSIYFTSVLSSIARSLGDSLPVETELIFRPSPLFSVGIQDIPDLTSRKSDPAGWLACTTDDILGEKKDLYDVLVQLPARQPLTPKVWPKMKTSDGRVLKASQRDLRRWTFLRRELRRLRRQTVGTFDDLPVSEPGANSDERPLLRRSRTSAELYQDSGLQDRDESEAVEPASWSAVAYRGFMWWASAGEASAWENDEAKADEELLFDMPDVSNLFPGGESSSRTQENWESEYARAAAILVVAYFRRVTEGILRTLTSIVEEADDDTEEGIQEEDITFTADDIRELGLDTWSEEDRIFVKDMMRKWFERDAVVTDQGLRVCGVRIC